MTQKRYYISIALVIGITIILNLLAGSFSLRLDFTEDKQYTLGRATKEILSNLQEPVTVKAYFSEDLPPDIARTKNDFKDMLIEYGSLSKGMVVYEFINPGDNEAKETEAMQNGIQPVVINVREKDENKTKKAYLGAMVQKGEEKDVIPFMQPGAAMEYALTTSIKKLSVKNKPKVGLLQGQGEPPLSEMFHVQQSLSVLYDVEELKLADTSAVPADVKVIAIVAPKDSFSITQLKKMDDFLGAGGKIFIAMNRVKGDMSNATGTTINTGLETWLQSKGIMITDDFIIDQQCGAVGVQQQQGAFRFVNNVAFPYIPVIQKFAEHPITKGLEAVVLPFASPIRYTGDSSKKFTPLIMTSEKSGTQKAPLGFDVTKRWAENDFPLSTMAVGAILQGKIAGSANSKMIVLSDGDFAVSGSREQMQDLKPDNVSLMANSIEWLCDETGLIELRTRGISSRPIATIEDGTKTLLKYMNFLLPLLLVIIYGVIRMQVKRNVRIRRMQENYG